MFVEGFETLGGSPLLMLIYAEAELFKPVASFVKDPVSISSWSQDHVASPFKL